MVNSPTGKAEAAFALSDLFPFGRKEEPAARDDAKDTADEPKSFASAEEKELTVNAGKNLLTKEELERFKKREISINTQTNFLGTVGSYMNMVTIALGGMAILLICLSTPLAGFLIQFTPAYAKIAEGAIWYAIPATAAALTSAAITLGIGQYNTRVNTAKNTDNSDWYQHRSSQMIGQEVAKAMKKEGLVVVNSARDEVPATSEQPTKRWTDTITSKLNEGHLSAAEVSKAVAATERAL